MDFFTLPKPDIYNYLVIKGISYIICFTSLHNSSQRMSISVMSAYTWSSNSTNKLKTEVYKKDWISLPLTLS